VIVLSLGTGMFESAKIQMGWNNNLVALVPIALSSIITFLSALITLRNFSSQMQIILHSKSLLTHTLTNARNENSITPVLLKEYNDALEKLESALYPDIRK
jgi:predicted acetyltransferase